MAEHDKDQHRRWAELMDRKALGEMLTSEELAFCERLAAEHPACAREHELLEQLAELDAAPSAESRALVDTVLARLADEASTAERDELSRIRRGGRLPWFVWASGAAAVAAVAVAAVLLPHKPAPEPHAAAAPAPAPRVELVYASGDVRVDGKAVAGSSAPLPEGSLLEVGHGTACLAMDPEINVCASEQSALRLSRTHSAWRRLDLESGKVAVQLAPQPEGYRLSVVADGVWSTAVGTAFTVARDPAAGVSTAVLNGKVRVGSDGGGERMVLAHQRSLVHDSTATLSSISRSEESPEWALLRPSRLWSNPVTASLTLRGLPAGAEVWLDDNLIGVAPLSSLIPAGEHRLQARLDGRVLVTRDFACEAGQTTVLAFSSAEITLAPQPPAQEPASASARRPPRARIEHTAAPTAPQPPTAGELLGRARGMMRVGRFEQAAAAYQSLRETYPDSPEAHTVLVSLAELQLDRLGQPRLALDNLERYLSDGSGSLVEEAQRVRIRALRALGEASQERDAIERFLQAHPRSFQARPLQQRLAELDARR